jgi:hypothetical protein
MKLPNFLIHTFAAVGVISLIFWSCAAADSDSIDNPPQLTGGTYQVSSISDFQIVVLNTETGVLKSYYMDYTDWKELGSNVVVGVNGNLTVTH